MAFTWTYRASPGRPITNKVFKEIRDNTDWVLDNPGCPIHNITFYPTRYSSYDYSEFGDVESWCKTVNSYNLTGDWLGNCPGERDYNYESADPTCFSDKTAHNEAEWKGDRGLYGG
jgi:hypothetical protein